MSGVAANSEWRLDCQPQGCGAMNTNLMTLNDVHYNDTLISDTHGKSTSVKHVRMSRDTSYDKAVVAGWR